MHRGWHVVILVVELLDLVAVRLQNVEASSIVIEVRVLIRCEMRLCEATQRAGGGTR